MMMRREPFGTAEKSGEGFEIFDHRRLPET
jgi:hypothetical protein